MKSKQTPKVAIVHSHLVQYGGGEKTVEAICELFPDAPIYTAMYKPGAMSKFIRSRQIITPGQKTNKLLTIFPILSKYFTFLLPTTFENFDLSNYDIVLSSCSSYAKGVLTKPNQLHIAYIHTPPRFLYKYSVESTKRDFFIYRPVVMLVDHYLRMWDYLAAQRADFLIANSICVRDRIRKFWRRDAKVIYPPVEIPTTKVFSQRENNLEQPYYVALGRISAYKNFDLIVQAFNLTGMRIKIMGTGSEETSLKKIAKNNIEFLGKVSEDEKHKILSGALGLIFPGQDEDFGIVPIEALSHGIPVLAHKSGGPAETIREGVDGLFFEELALENFVEKLRKFDKMIQEKAFDKEKMVEHAREFSKETFQKEFHKFVMEKWGKLDA